MTSSRRDEGVDEHPQPKNNAEWSGRDIDSSEAQSPQGPAGGREQFVIHSPGMLQTFRASGINQNLKTSLLCKDFWQPV
jgi:hypothetical protein